MLLNTFPQLDVVMCTIFIGSVCSVTGGRALGIGEEGFKIDISLHVDCLIFYQTPFPCQILECVSNTGVKLCKGMCVCG